MRSMFRGVELLRLHCGVVGEDGPSFPGRSYGGVISDNTLNVALEVGLQGAAHGSRISGDGPYRA